ncbi:MAG: ComEC/Rec2 family competence protein, partial [Patescibacteria group bacterium]
YVLSFLNFKKRILFSSVGILIFVILVGASAAVLRAGLMGLLTLWGLYAGRKSQALFGLLWSALIMTLINPYTLVYDIGFQLSFAATLGILLFHPMLAGLFPDRKKFLWVREPLLLTLSAQITTTPFMLLYFGRFSLISPLANLLVAPLIPLAMLFSGLSLLFGETAAMAAWVYLKGVEMVALGFARIPFADFAWQISSAEFFASLFFLIAILIRFYKPTLLRSFGLDPGASFYKLSNRESGKREK